jgi:hypothetical protein
MENNRNLTERKGREFGSPIQARNTEEFTWKLEILYKYRTLEVKKMRKRTICAVRLILLRRLKMLGGA